MVELQEIDTEATFETLTKDASSSTLFVLYFHTPWAAPCAQMKTILSTLASTYNSSQPIQFLSINAEDLPEISESYDVTAVPFLVLQRDSKTLETVSGSDATKVRSAVEKHFSSSSANGTSSAIPPPLDATPQTNGNINDNRDSAPSTTKDLSSYAPTDKDPQTGPEFSSEGVTGDKEALHSRLADLTKAAPVMLFMKGTPSAPQCGFSRQLVSILRENGVKYGFFNILADDEVRQGLKEYADWPTFPQLWTKGELVGGLDIVKEEMAADPEFLKPFVAAPPKAAGGMAAPEQQTATAA